MLQCGCCGLLYDRKNKKEDRIIYGCVSCDKGARPNHDLTSTMPQSRYVYSGGKKRGKPVDWNSPVWVKT